MIGTGATSATFTANAPNAVTTNVQPLLTATWNGTSQNFSLSLNATPGTGPAVSSLACSPTSLPGGGTVTCTVTLSAPAPNGGTTVSVSSSSPNLTAPNPVTVAAGAVSAAFTVSTQVVNATQSPTLTAAVAGSSKTTTITLEAGGPAASLSCAPAMIQTPGSSTCTISLASAAATSYTFSLSSSSASLSVPVSATIGAGATSTTFKAQAAAVTANAAVTVSVSGGGSQILTLLAQGSTVPSSGLSCSPSTLTGGGSVNCAFTLPAAAPSGATAQLSSSSSQLTLPAAVQVSAGSSTAQFTATSSVIDYDENATISATVASSSMQTQVSLVGLKPVSLSCSPKTAVAGSTVTCQVTLNSSSAMGSVPVTLTSSDPHLIPPASVSTKAGQATIQFQANTTAVTQAESATISVTLHNVVVEDTVTLVLSGPVLTVPGTQSVQAGKPLNFTISAADASGASALVSASALPQNAWFDPAHGAFSWVPETSQIGIHTVHFTATDIAGATSSADVMIKVESSTPIVLSMENAASYVNDGGCSPGSVVSLFGGSFTHAQGEAAQSSPLPIALNGVHVTVNDIDVPLLYASEFQVNLQCPQDAPGTSLTVVVETANGQSTPLSSTVQYATPGIFSLDGSGTGQGAILIANTSTVAMTHVDGIPSQPVKAGDFISIYATGLGPIDTNVPSGQPAPLDSLVRVVAPVDVLINGAATQVQFAGLAPGYIGLYQVNARIPAKTAASDAVTVQLVVHRPDGTGALSNVVTIAVTAAD